MDKSNNDDKNTNSNSKAIGEITPPSRYKQKSRTRKRKRKDSESDEYEDVLPENTLEVEKSVIASAVKNNLDDASVKKILKKVVTNDHVLALVKLREEEEEDSGQDETSAVKPKLTRAKVKELMKVSPKSAPWNLENIELTPIKHIPVKTRPEVKALIAQELPEDEDDEEYRPNHDDVPSDDDQTIESCSDLDSQPRTPATPSTIYTPSPKVLKDGPFKVPQDLSSARRKLQMQEEEATIALRTRSKLSLSATPIEHIESSFIPPDDLPMPAVDDLWNQFLEECLNPTSNSKHEDDDEADPEYNVAADPDAHEEDEEALENSIIKISKKELNDLVTELFSIMPEATADESLVDNLAGKLIDTSVAQSEVSTLSTRAQWEGKQEPLSDEEATPLQITAERRLSRFSIGKTEPLDPDEVMVVAEKTPERPRVDLSNIIPTVIPSPVAMSVQETNVPMTAIISNPRQPPPPLLLRTSPIQGTVVIKLTTQINVLPQQVQILQQQLRQHIQLSACNFLQLCVHPKFWHLAPAYKEYLESLMKLVEKNPNSVANVCNLKSALELTKSWESSVTANTPENKKMVDFIQSESVRAVRRAAQNKLYVGDFHDTFKQVVANSGVFLYPDLLPPVPYRTDLSTKKFAYYPSEDALIALGIDQFWQYVDSNPKLFPLRAIPKRRPGFTHVLECICKYMLPWYKPRSLLHHIRHIKDTKVEENPLFKFLTTQKIDAVDHVLLPFNPNLTLYEQPEHEIPRIWIRYLAKNSKRFKNYLHRRGGHLTPQAPSGVLVKFGKEVETPNKKPLPIDFYKEIKYNRQDKKTKSKTTGSNRLDIDIAPPVPTTLVAQNLFKVVETKDGAYLVPFSLDTATTNSTQTPISSPVVSNNKKTKNSKGAAKTLASNLPEKSITESVDGHCRCCQLLRKQNRFKQKSITDYFQCKNRRQEKLCPCRGVRHPKNSRKLRLLVNRYKSGSECITNELDRQVGLLKRGMDTEDDEMMCTPDDIAFVSSYHIKVTARTALAKNYYMKTKVYNLFAKFNPDLDEAVTLATELYTAFEVELVDLYKEFLSFLTPGQADAMGKFKDYFLQHCVVDLLKKINEHIKEKEKKLRAVTVIDKALKSKESNPCEICCTLLTAVAGYPKLAEYVFNLFPHTRRKCQKPAEEKSPPKSSQPLQEVAEDPVDAPATDVEAPLTSCTDCEPERRSSAEEETIQSDVPNETTKEKEPQSNELNPMAVKVEPQDNNFVVVIEKTENDDCSDSDESMRIMSDEESMKLEAAEWRRDEDKLLLEILKQHLTPEERKNKTILEIIEEKNVLQMVSESLLDKSIHDIKERVLYLLELLVLSENDQ